MKKLYQFHNRCVAMYFITPACAILLAIVCAKFFHLLLPFQLVAGVICLTPLVCSLLRLSLWRKRDALFSHEEQNSRPAQIFFGVIPAEIAFSVIAIGFLLFS